MKKQSGISIIAGFAVVCFFSSAHAGLLYNYGQLATKDLDQMNAIVQMKIKEAKQESGDKTIPLKEGVQAIYSRPDDDGTIEKVISPLKSALEDEDAWESTLKKLATEAIGALRNPKAFQPVVQVTYEVFLENLVAQLKPKADGAFEKSILTQIRDADIVVTKDAQHERLRRVMSDQKSPSILAAQVLKEAANRPKVEVDVAGDTLVTKEKEKDPKATPTASPTAKP